MRVMNLLSVTVTLSAATQLGLKQVSTLPVAPCYSFPRLQLSDLDHDGYGEVAVTNSAGFQIAKYQPVNRYLLVFSDSSHWPLSETIYLGNLDLLTVGDVDNDGLTDVAGQAPYRDSAGQFREGLGIFESRDVHSYPDSLVWRTTYPVPHGAFLPAQYADLDGDSAVDIVSSWTEESSAVFECTGDNRCSLVCVTWGAFAHWFPTIGDFDRNGRVEYTFRNLYRDQEYVIECVGDNRYLLVCSLAVDWEGIPYDRFSGQDVDRNGRLEFFESAHVPLGGMRRLHALRQFEATAEHQYYCDTVDTAYGYDYDDGMSLCADVDGDSLEEIVWSCGRRVLILEAVGPHEYEKVSNWRMASGSVSVCNAADFNHNGYKEIYVAGDPTSIVLEVECIRVLSPDTNHFLRSGDTCEIRWQVLSPPRCDSVSLFLLTDTIVPTGEWFWRLDTIVTGLAPTESSYLWVVPEMTLAWAKILAIAYGPGWQFDESYRAFQIAPVGACEAPVPTPANWSLSVSQNPIGERAFVRYDVPVASDVSLTLVDATGRVMSELASGPHQPGSYSVPLRPRPPSGVLFLRLQADADCRVAKVVFE